MNAARRLATALATLAVLFWPAVAGAAALPAAVTSALREPTLAGAHVGLLAVDAQTGSVLAALDADDDFVPASTLKLIVGSAALARLGPSFSFVTDVAAGTPIAGGVLQGDVYLRGGGDPQLSLHDLDAAAQAVAAAGVTRVSGSVVADATRYDAPHYPAGWVVDDLPYGYAAVPSALCLQLNVAQVRVRPGSSVGEATMLLVTPPADLLTIENRSTTGPAGSADTTDLARPWDRPQSTIVIGRYPLGAGPSDDLEPAVPNPPLYAAAALERALNDRGVGVAGAPASGATPSTSTVLWTHRSKPLRDVLRDFWPPSTNLIGEQLLEELGTTAHGSGDTRARGISAETAWLRSIGADPSTLTIADGSGLSSYDRATPRALVAVLRADWRSRLRSTVLAALPIAGISGTLHGRFTAAPLRGAVYAKTGSMNHSRALAGYVRTRSGRETIFALMVDDWGDASPGADAALDAARAAVLEALVAR